MVTDRIVALAHTGLRVGASAGTIMAVGVPQIS